MGSPSKAGRIGLPQLPRKLLELTGQPAPGGYRRLYIQALNGRIPAELENGRWYVSEADVPGIAAALGMTSPAGMPGGAASPVARAA